MIKRLFVCVLLLITIGCSAGTSPYCDGRYVAEAKGKRLHLTVAVTIQGGRIADVEVIEHYEKGLIYYERPFAELPAAIVAEQTADVDVIAGSTLTSQGLINATKKALALAACPSD